MSKVDIKGSWEQNDPVLLNKEIGYIRETGEYKIGDGTKRWSELNIFGGRQYFTENEANTIKSQSKNMANGIITIGNTPIYEPEIIFTKQIGTQIANHEVDLGFNNTIESDVDYEEAHSVAVNVRNTISGRYNFIGGIDNTIYGNSSTVFGTNNTSAGHSNFVVGGENFAGGHTNAVFGGNNDVVGGWNVVMGYHNIIKDGETGNSANYNFVNGRANEVSDMAAYSTVLGEYNKIDERFQGATVVGKYNDYSNPFIFAVGVGTSDANRKNAIEVSEDGKVYINGEEPLTASSGGEMLTKIIEVGVYPPNNTNMLWIDVDQWEGGLKYCDEFGNWLHVPVAAV